MKKKGLGRGLSSLLKEDDFITDENLLTLMMIVWKNWQIQ